MSSTVGYPRFVGWLLKTPVQLSTTRGRRFRQACKKTRVTIAAPTQQLGVDGDGRLRRRQNDIPESQHQELSLAATPRASLPHRGEQGSPCTRTQAGRASASGRDGAGGQGTNMPTTVSRTGDAGLGDGVRGNGGRHTRGHAGLPSNVGRLRFLQPRRRKTTGERK